MTTAESSSTRSRSSDVRLADLEANHPVTHLDLLNASRDVQRLAAGEDADALHDEVCRLRNALVAHMHDERAADKRLDDQTQRLARHGQQRLLRFVDELLCSTSEDQVDHCSCLVRAAELRMLLLRQVRLENRIVSRSTRRR